MINDHWDDHVAFIHMYVCGCNTLIEIDGEFGTFMFYPFLILCGIRYSPYKFNIYAFKTIEEWRKCTFLMLSFSRWKNGFALPFIMRLFFIKFRKYILFNYLIFNKSISGRTIQNCFCSRTNRNDDVSFQFSCYVGP